MSSRINQLANGNSFHLIADIFTNFDKFVMFANGFISFKSNCFFSLTCGASFR